MSVSMPGELQLFVQEIQSYLSSHTLRDFARDVGFVQRTSKYQAKDLVAFCVWISQNVASSQTCSHCDYKNKDVKSLNLGEWKCPSYSMYHDRDVNAAENLRKEAVRLLTIGTTRIAYS
ncbi:zinc ribbon domain-containing protein [Bacillus mycoides]|uniref:zinc ribbon domain-containing protein n=1 Tax=Bacillus mycoides TaxID=1405 RepID=UPI0011A66AEA|nr:zinc ribbon domain-containing protein [Bacillus mycoides]